MTGHARCALKHGIYHFIHRIYHKSPYKEYHEKNTKFSWTNKKFADDAMRINHTAYMIKLGVYDNFYVDHMVIIDVNGT